MRTPSTRPPGRPKHVENHSMRAIILRAAAQRFMDDGYDAVSMDDIARQSGVTKASVYYYFPTKAEVFTAAIDALLALIHRESQQILAGPGALRNRLLRLTKVRLSVAESRFDFEHVISEADGQLPSEQLEQVRTSMHHLVELIAEAIAAATKNGEVGPCDPLFAAHAYLALLNVAYAEDASGKALFSDPDASAEHLVTLLFCGITPQP